jgi:hypothetical protein
LAFAHGRRARNVNKLVVRLSGHLQWRVFKLSENVMLRLLIASAAALICVACPVGQSVAQAGDARRPNIIFILADDE